MSESIYIPKDTIKRLIIDIKEIKRNPLNSHNIYYYHDEKNILKGYACIIGPKDTPYEDGYYIFELNFPTNYPHSPPKVVFLYDNSCKTRFNPNLYVSGKVCLSILNTWRGDAWNGCQTISSLLLSICTIFNNKPLLNEPGVKETHGDFNKYNILITYKNYEVSIIKNINSAFLKKNIPKIHTLIVKDFLDNFESKNNNLLKKSNILNIKNINTRIYNMNYVLNFNKLCNDFNELYYELK
jgi:ubiquitin-protein ligase